MDLALTPTQKDVALRTMKLVAMANGTFAEEERALLAAAADALEVDVDLDSLGGIEPAEAGRELVAPLERQRLVQAMIVMALIDGDAGRDEVAVIERFALELGVDEPKIKNLHHVIDGHLGRLRFRFPAPRAAPAKAREGSLGEGRPARDLEARPDGHATRHR